MPRAVSKRRVRRIQRNTLRRQGASQSEINQLVPILMAQIGQETGFRTNIGSRAGAQDVAQFMPDTARSYGVTLGDNQIRDDIRGQVKMMYPLIQRYGVGGALRAYNAGEGNMNAGFSETVNYESAVKAGADRYRRPGGERGTVGHVGPGKTIVVGDSLGEGTVPFLKDLIGGRFRSDTLEGRSSADGIDALARMLAQGRKPRQVVLDLGTNDGSAAELRASIRRAKQLVPKGTKLIVPTVNGPDAHAKNAMLRQLGGITLVDWAKQASRHPGFMASDGIHATEQGYQRRATKIARALGRGGHPGQSVAGLGELNITSGGQTDPMAVLALIDTLKKDDSSSLEVMDAVKAVSATSPETTTTLPGMPGLTVPSSPAPKSGGKVTVKGGPKRLKNAKGGIYEVFYDPLGAYWDTGAKRQGQIGGHSDHVHVSADTPYVVAAGELAQRMGLTVREQSHFDPVDAVHTDTSFHYKDQAIDVSGDPALMRKFAILMMHQAGRGGRGK